jgi:hypothetical protein
VKTSELSCRVTLGVAEEAVSSERAELRVPLGLADEAVSSERAELRVPLGGRWRGRER